MHTQLQIQDSDPPNEDDGSSTCPVLPVTLSATSMISSSMPLNTHEHSPIIAGSVIGSSIVLLLIVGFVLLAVCISRHRKTKTSQVKQILTIIIDNDEMYRTSNYIGVGDHSELA